MSRAPATRPHGLPGGDLSLPYRHLAVRVIDQALRDLAGPAQSRNDRESARAFLAGSPMLRLWCAVAEIDARWLVVHLQKRPAGSGGSFAGAGGFIE